MESSSEKSVRLPTFDGEHKKFQLWWTRFKAYAMVYKFSEALIVGGEAYLPGGEGTTIDETTEDGKKQALAKKRNAIAVANLSMAFTTEGTMGIIYKSMTSEWPSGLAHLVVASLMKKYRPQDTITRVELRQMLNRVSMKKNQDPATLFEQLSSIENQYNAPGKKIDEGDLIAVILDAAPAEYQAVLTAEQRLRGDELALSDLETAMNQHWRQTKSPKTNDDEGSDFALSSMNFGGFCYNCKQKGHKANKCPKKNGGKSGGGKQNNNGGGSGKFGGKCNNCGKVGHRGSDCWDKEENASKRPNGYRPKGEMGASAMDDGDSKVEFLLCGMSFSNDQSILNDPNVWIADSAATVHTTPHTVGLTNLRDAGKSDAITMGNGACETAAKIADLGGVMCDKHGTEKGYAVMKDVTLLPNGKYNLFSLTKMMKNGWKLGGDEKLIYLQKGDKKIEFDITIPTPKGVLFAMYMQRDSEIAGAGADTVVRLTVAQAHDKLGHMGEDLTRKTAKALGWELSQGGLKPCDACSAGKAKQKNVPKASEHIPATTNNERIFLDIATLRKNADGPNVTKPNWRIMVDERTQLKFSDFFETKNGMVEATCEQLFKWKQNGKEVKFIRLDNAGENKLLKTRADSSDWKLGIEFEFTGRDTPQRNHLAEVSFAVVASRGRAMMHRANVPLAIRYKVWKEAFKTATLLDGLVVIALDGKEATRYVHWNGHNPAFAKHLRIWGEAGTVKVKTNTTPKVVDRGVHCMMVGYALHHAGDTYRMWDKETNRVHETRDVIWLKRMYFETPVARPTLLIEPVIDADHGDDNPSIEVGEGENNPIAAGNDTVEAEEAGDVEEAVNVEEAVDQGMRTRSGRAVNNPTRLIEEMAAVVDDYKCRLTDAEANYYSAMKEIGALNADAHEFGMVGAGLGGGFENTAELHAMKYNAAMQTKDKVKWEQAVEKEHERMVDNDVWEPVKKSEIPSGTKVLTSTWAMKKKASGVFRARLNARGYEQVDGIHYDENTKSAPVTNEMTIRMVLILLVMARWHAEILDVQGAFLKGRFENGEKIYMDVPQGFEKYYDPQVWVLLLRRTIYGTKQAAYAFWRELLKAFKSMDYSRSKADPCLYFAWTVYGLIVWLSWVDDCLVCGKKEGVLQAKKQMMERFDCDEVGELKEYIGCKIDYDREGGSIKVTQPVLLQSFVDEFDLPKGDTPVTPAVPGDVLRRGEPKDYVPGQVVRKYRCGTGKLMHLTKWSRPEVMNAVRELSRYMSGALGSHVQAMYRVMKYCVGTPNRGLLLKPNARWDGDPNFEFVISGLADSDYAKDPETRRSVSGYGTFLCEAPVSQKSKMQGCVTLSVTEAESVSATHCAQDMLFMMRVLESMGLKVAKPMILRIDNKGAMDLTHNWSVGGRTRHVDVRYMFLRELKEEGILVTEWISTDDNASDIFTKNLGGPKFEKHTSVYCGVDEYMKYRDSSNSQGEGVPGHRNRDSG